ncbi:aspartate transaminase [Lentilactobacillus senioris DSM 24302 = JCM 17472]|uniref:Aminotransferase n=1 Tax=Lentilactobacillus senioris DSM 24302 = JCM 17472 TaxID=1423802 RepID=A0A0R2CR83_9LACO|nr:aminotransferase [Lentilactobacillus senioris]KRM94184.1 aspartate transaminase [Lentilactobacillus senioris DSM 24302 = JCM 17472]
MVEIAGFGVEAWLNEWETKAQYDISQSTIASLTLEELVAFDPPAGQQLLTDLKQNKLNYGHIEGSPEFKQEVSKLYDHMSADNILQTNGATGANHLVLYALLNSGDHVVAEYPSYQQLYDIPKSLGAEVDFWPIEEDQDWQPSLTKLKELVRSDTKMICLNNANNPTGTVLDRTFLEQVVAIAKTVGAYVLVDEVYQPLATDVDYKSIVDLYDRGIATNSLSKTYSVPGIRIGWTASNAEVTNIFRTFRDYTMICGGVLGDLVATYVLQHRDQVLARNRDLVTRNLKILTDWVAQEPRVSLATPQMVSTSFPRLDISEDTEAFCLRLLKETGVLLVPGERFDLPGHVRLGYCAPTQVLQTGLKLLSEFLRQYN